MAQKLGRLVYIEPNLFAEEQGIKFGSSRTPETRNNRTWNPEDFNISVDLQVVVPNRGQKNSDGQTFPVTMDSLGQYTSFLGGSHIDKSIPKKDGGNYLTTEYTEASYSEIRAGNVSTTESLGISSIDIRFDAHFFPQVTMKLTDVRGYSLFMPAEEEYQAQGPTGRYNSGNASKPGRPYTNLFKAVFHFPYPQFLLTIKGFYGNKVTFILAVSDFKTALNGQNGNFDVTISFIGYMFGLYTDIPMNYILIAPYIDSKDGQLLPNSYWEQQASRFVSRTANSNNPNDATTERIPTFIELARNFAELNITSDDVSGTDTEKYNNYLSAYNNLNSIITLYEEVVYDFGRDINLYVNSGSTDKNNIYIIQNNTEYNWNQKTGKAKALYDKIKSYKETYDGFEYMSGYTLNYPFLTKAFTENKDAKIETKDMISMYVSSKDKKLYLTDKHSDLLFKDGTTEIIYNGDKGAHSLDGNLTKTIKSLIKNEDTSYTVLAFPSVEWINDAKTKLNAIGEAKKASMEDAAKSATEVYSNKLGYSLTIENVFRMLFAHVECFFYYYLKETIEAIVNENPQRTFTSCGLDIADTDSSVNTSDPNTFVTPFPALFKKDSRRELLYPGDKVKIEATLVDKIYDASKMCSDMVAELNELMAQQGDFYGSDETVITQPESSESQHFMLPISFNNSFTPLMLTDAFCNNKNPYSLIPLNKNDETTYSFADEILYMSYLRYCAYLMSIDDTLFDLSDLEKYFVETEFQNITKAFPKLDKSRIERITKLKNLLTQNSFNHTGIDQNQKKAMQILKGRIGENFDISSYKENAILCTGYDTTEYNVKSDIDQIKQYTQDELRGVYVLPETTFDVFKSMCSNEGFNKYNYLFDFRDADYKTYGKTVLNNTKKYNNTSRFGNALSDNRVWFIPENVREKFTNEIDEVKPLIYNSLTSNEEYFEFIKQKRDSSEYIGVYCPSVFYKTKDSFDNLFLSDFFWKQTDEGKAFLLLSSLLNSNLNQILYNDSDVNGVNKGMDQLTKIGVRTYRIRKLWALYYGALIHRLRKQITTLNEQTCIGEDIVKMGDSNDTFGITKDVYNQYTYNSVSGEGDMVKMGEYYFPTEINAGINGRRKFTKDAPLLTFLSTKNAVVYRNLCLYKQLGDHPEKVENFRNGILYKDVIETLSDTYSSKPYFVGTGTKLYKWLTSILKWSECDRYTEGNSFGLESYFLDWVKNDFSKFLDILKKDYLQPFENSGTTSIIPIEENWLKLKVENNRTMPIFKYSEDYDSPSMFLSRLQCEQVTVLMCVPVEQVKEMAYFKKLYHEIENYQDVAERMMSKVFDKINEYYTDKSNETDEIYNIGEENGSGSEEVKKAIYYTLKSLYDKWICGYGNFNRFKLPPPNEDHDTRVKRYEKGQISKSGYTEMNNFLFVDSFYNDIGNRFYCEPSLLYNLIMSCFNGTYNCSVYQFMSRLTQENKLLMKALPVYNNFYNVDTIKEIFTPHNSYDVTNKSNEYLGYGSTYIIMYTHEPSKHLNEESKEEIVYRDDGFDLGNTWGDIVKTDAVEKNFEDGDNDVKVPVPAFGVTYGMQNQQYFKGININMDNPMTTDYAIANTLQLSQTGAKGDKNFPMGIGQNIYAIYSNRSYTITVEMMGCANIMPMMYFQLNNVPMFKGAYMIVSVSHSIKAGTMTTTFTGIRQSMNMYPFVTSDIILTSVMDRMNKRGISLGRTRREDSGYISVEGHVFDDTIGIKLDNALDASKYQWKQGSHATPYPYRSRGGVKPTKIVLHYTAGPSSKDGAAGKLVKDWVNKWNGGGGGSADFGVDDGGIYQFTPDIDTWYASWCNGGDHQADGRGGRTDWDKPGYSRGIGIEMCSTLKNGTSYLVPNHDGWYFSTAVLNNTAKLCAKLIRHFGWKCETIEDIDKIISTHYRVAGKKCPGIRGWNNGQWNQTQADAKGNAIPIPNSFNNEDKFKEFKQLVFNALKVYK